MKLAVPDLISNSYFPALAAPSLGSSSARGSRGLRSNGSSRSSRPMRHCAMAKSISSAAPRIRRLRRFPTGRCQILGAQAQGMYWFLVMRCRSWHAARRPRALKGRRIGAAPWVGLGLRRLLARRGIDPERDRVRSARCPGRSAPRQLRSHRGGGAGGGQDRRVLGQWHGGRSCGVARRRRARPRCSTRRRADRAASTTRWRCLRRPSASSPRIAAGRRQRCAPSQRPTRRSGQRRAGDASRPSALSACRGGADRGDRAPRSAVLLHGDLTGVRRRHEPVRPRSRHPVPGRRLRAGRRLSDVVGSGSVTTAWMIAAVRHPPPNGGEKN